MAIKDSADAIQQFERASTRGLLCAYESIANATEWSWEDPFPTFTDRIPISDLGSYVRWTDIYAPVIHPNRSNSTGAPRAHHGVDLVTDSSDRKLKAPFDAIVLYCDRHVSKGSYGGYGKRIVLLDPSRALAISLSHLAVLPSLRVGSVVKKGQYVGTEGGSGSSMSSYAIHTHLELFDVAGLNLLDSQGRFKTSFLVPSLLLGAGSNRFKSRLLNPCYLFTIPSLQHRKDIPVNKNRKFRR